AMNPSVNVSFTDVWSNPTKDPDILYSYADPEFHSAPPTPLACITGWTAQCRITINYVQNIQPLWDADRTVDVSPADGMPDVDANGVVMNHKCTLCHGPQDTVNNVAQIPAGQLDLSAVASNEQPLRLLSYQELFFGDNAQELVGGAPQDILVPGP